jgi:hypothetical protein
MTSNNHISCVMLEYPLTTILEFDDEIVKKWHKLIIHCHCSTSVTCVLWYLTIP